jgi:hypothetical protein
VAPEGLQAPHDLTQTVKPDHSGRLALSLEAGRPVISSPEIHPNMTNDSKPSEDEGPSFIGEEESDERSTPTKNLGAAVVIGALGVFAMILAVRLPIPSTIYTAPGLLPFLTGLTLLAMAFSLGLMAVREGASKNFFQSVSRAWEDFFRDDENRRTLYLIGIIFIYVMLVNEIAFDAELPVMGMTIRFSSYELLSTIALTVILRIFWRAPVLKCIGVSLPVVVAIASAFRYAFHILLPGLA